jgi:enoyl-CoA hydratase
MIRVEAVGDVTVVTLDGGKANALSLELLEHIAVTFAKLDGAVVLTGVGSSFSAGVDLLRIVEGGPSYVEPFMAALSRAFLAVFTHPAPVVAAINGHAIAGGCVIAAACDQRLMSGGQIGLTELAVGVAFPIAAIEICRFAFGAAATRLTLAAELFGAAQAKALGVVDEVVEPADLMSAATILASRLGSFPPDAYVAAKQKLQAPALERIAAGQAGDAEVVRSWCAEDTHALIRQQLQAMAARRSGANG